MSQKIMRLVILVMVGILLGAIVYGSIMFFLGTMLFILVVLFVFRDDFLGFWAQEKKDMKGGFLKKHFKKSELDEVKDVFAITQRLFRDYFLVLIFFIFIWSFLDNFVLQTYYSNFRGSAIILFVSVMICIDDIKAGEIYLGKRLITFKEIFLGLSIEIIAVFYILFYNLDYHVRIFLAVMLGNIFYLLSIGAFGFWKNFDIRKSKIFWVYAGFTFLSFLCFIYGTFPQIKDYLTIEKIVYQDREVHVEKLVYIYTGNENTGTNNAGVQNTGYNMTGTISTQTTGTQEITEVTYAELIPYLVDKYKLTTRSTKTIDFKSINKTDKIYQDFSIAYNKRLIGTNINPTAKVTCGSYITMLGLINNRDITGLTGTTIQKYRQKGTILKTTQSLGCTQDQILTSSALTK